MFIEIIKPKIVDIYRTKGRVKIRLSESETLNRLSLNLTFETEDDLKAFSQSLANEVSMPMLRE